MIRRERRILGPLVALIGPKNPECGCSCTTAPPGHDRWTRKRATRREEVAMHTVKVIAGGFLLLAVCLLIGRLVGGATPGDNLASAAKVFLPLWLVGAAVNMWIGVSKAGYTVADEAPVFLVVFAIPAVVALLLLWRLSRH
jgi:hypothetical protein